MFPVTNERINGHPSAELVIGEQGTKNSKSCKPFYPTLPSTMKKIKDECHTSGPKQVIADVSACLGGVMSATDACELPRDEQQVSQAKLRSKYSKSASSSYSGAPGDELSVIMHRAFMEEKAIKVKLFVIIHAWTRYTLS